MRSRLTVVVIVSWYDHHACVCDVVVVVHRVTTMLQMKRMSRGLRAVSTGAGLSGELGLCSRTLQPCRRGAGCFFVVVSAHC